MPDEEGPLSPSITTPLPSVDMTSQEQRELGYLPLRDDFERVGAIQWGFHHLKVLSYHP